MSRVQSHRRYWCLNELVNFLRLKAGEQHGCLHRAHLPGKNNVEQRRRFSHLILSKRIMHNAFVSNNISDDVNSYCRVFMSTHTHKVHERKRVQLNKRILEILRTVPYEKGFHFYTAHGNYTGETATSLHDFELKIQVVPAASVNFHIERHDFQKWISDTLGDTELAKRISLV
jgi:hypothetical protein